MPRLRSLRILLAVALLIAAAFAFAPQLLNRISTSAAINTDMLRLTAPMNGLASPDLPDPGRRVRRGEEIQLVRELVLDERELRRLSQELDGQRARARRLRESLAALEAHERDLLERQARFQRLTEDVLRREEAEAASARRAAQARIARAEAELSYAEDMFRRRIFAEPRVEAARAALAAAVAEAEALTERLAAIETRIVALREGVHMRDGYNDVPYTRQQLDRVLLSRETLLDQLAEAEARERALAVALAVEEEAVRRRSVFSVRLDADMVVWQRHVSPGAPVGAGMTMLDLVRCDQLHVEAVLPDRAFAALTLGGEATIRLSGGVTLSGRVASMHGAGARAARSLAAAEPPTGPFAGLRVRVDLPPEAASVVAHPTEGSFCGIGRLAEVSFPAGVLADAGSALSRWFSPLIGLGGPVARTGSLGD